MIPPRIMAAALAACMLALGIDVWRMELRRRDVDEAVRQATAAAEARHTEVAAEVEELKARLKEVRHMRLWLLGQD